MMMTKIITSYRRTWAAHQNHPKIKDDVRFATVVLSNTAAWSTPSWTFNKSSTSSSHWTWNENTYHGLAQQNLRCKTLGTLSEANEQIRVQQESSQQGLAGGRYYHNQWAYKKAFAEALVRQRPALPCKGILEYSTPVSSQLFVEICANMLLLIITTRNWDRIEHFLLREWISGRGSNEMITTLWPRQSFRQCGQFRVAHELEPSLQIGKFGSHGLWLGLSRPFLLMYSNLSHWIPPRWILPTSYSLWHIQ